jgi:aspartyl-tRNA(Asn)/glutamyl-tRNA(Gln) amidotransferase subunit A
MHNYSISQLSSMLETKQLSSLELTQHYLNRIKDNDAQVNSFITVCEEKALAKAKSIDDMRTNQSLSPLAGIPMAHKDIFCTQGLKTSCASKMLDNFIAPYDAFVVEEFERAGSVLLGKTNMDEFAMGSSNENSHYGPVKNPWNHQHVPGGSSGGSAAAVAARLTPFATGTDTGGSIRQPAAFCGITGLKPTYGRISRFGMIAFASSLDQAGPMAASAEDLALILETMAGFDERDSTCVEHKVPSYSKHLNDSLEGMKIGIPKAFFGQGLDEEIKQAIHTAALEFEKLGAQLIEIDINYLDYCVPCYYVIASAEASSNLSRYDGVRYGYRTAKAEKLHEFYQKTRSEGFGEEVKRRILTGTYTLSAGYFDAYYLQAQRVRRMIRDEFKNALDKVDVLLCPTTPTTAFKLGEKCDDPISMYLSDIYTIGVNLAGLPGLSLPIGFKEGLPIGMQLIGNHFQEQKLLNLAHRYQGVSDWHQKIPTHYL